MKQIVLEVPAGKYKFFHDLMKELGFAKTNSKKKNADEVYRSVEQGLKEVSLIRKGKLAKKPVEKLLNEV